MPEEPSEPLDSRVRSIRHLVRLMQRYDLTAIDVVEGETKIRLRRRGAEPVAACSATAAPLP
ncbi:MAG: acetyl-CoA carboxylase, biotin carboxyl carrier protein, partial [Isosphaeraceae bacterium]|nr:acetyl-CoA carboxylase, biotin carboxyl carrier protein [Isosphaeraceae bacterium]